MGQGDGGLHDVAPGPVVLGHPAQLVEGPPHRARSPARPATARRPRSAPPRPVGSTLRMFPSSPSPTSGEGAVSVKQFTPTTFCSPSSMRRTRSAWLRTRRCFSSSMASKAPPSASTSSSSVQAASASSAVLASMTVRALEDVVVLEQVGLEGQDLLHAQGPLLVPGPGQTQRLVPRRQLHGPGPGVLRQRDAELLEHDSLHVVLRLLLGQAERVDLHAVAEAPQLGVLDAVALAADAVPQLGEGAHLARLLDEADARVDEEADAADHGGQLGRVDLAGLAHAVEHADGGGQRVGDLLHRCGPRLLQVVAADVDRVPLGHVAHRVGDGVDGEPEARSRREDVGPPAEILLDDVVLRRARQLAGRHAQVLRVGHVEAEQPRRRGVDRHGGVHRRHRDLVEQLVHVPEVRHGHADLADLARRLGRVGVVAGLRRQVEGDGQAGLTLGQVGPVQLVGGAGGGVARVRPHHPAAASGSRVIARDSLSRPPASAARHHCARRRSSLRRPTARRRQPVSGCSRRTPAWSCDRAGPR